MHTQRTFEDFSDNGVMVVPKTELILLYGDVQDGRFLKYRYRYKQYISICYHVGFFA